MIETLRLTHSTTGQLAETDIRNRLPSEQLLKRVAPAQIDAAFAAPTTLKVADRLAEIAQKMTIGQPDLTLDAVHGVGEVRTYLNQILNELNAWRTGELAWDEVTSSAVFYGPLGTGKTTLASAFAGSAGIPIISTSYADCQKHGHQGDMLAALDKAFANAKNAAPAVLFIDELDSFTQRDTPEFNSIYMRGVVNGLLEQINRAKDVEGLILLGATNSLEAVDPAVIRSGRFDLKLHVPLPDKKGIEAILTSKIGSTNVGGLDLCSIADQLLGQSGAVADAVVRDALGRARADAVPVNQAHLEAAADRIAPKPEIETLRRAAIHEAGHVVAMTQLGWSLPKRVCLTGEGGKVEHEPFSFMTPSKARERLVVLLAGRASEICVLGAPSSGAGIGDESDLAKATSIAMSIERQWGFGETGLLWDAKAATDIWSVPGYVRRRAEQHLMEAKRNALALMKEHKAKLITLAKHLLRVRDMTARDVELFNYYHASQGSARMSLG
ncbi:ATP-dependent Zn protease [Roseovarius mucosus DSM 17069]|uniref:ATP-dependent Zn protease n=1 Tax=Roseovarius mucosus DSM 17069 TaxID=1288298 RepID=A0A0A0HJR6_9RHOB|nr:AAA family ATPase [Roseovarius mucosus]KGM87415.1 ATP-dependent Zn protease [Roseovarius mucosus DSM 17069]